MSAACKHTPAPTGYAQWVDWAERKAKTHDQVECPHCGRFAIWVRKPEVVDLQAPS